MLELEALEPPRLKRLERLELQNGQLQAQTEQAMAMSGNVDGENTHPAPVASFFVLFFFFWFFFFFLSYFFSLLFVGIQRWGMIREWGRHVKGTGVEGGS